MEQHEIALRMEGLVVFRGLLKDPVVAAFYERVAARAQLPLENVLADALYKLAGELSLEAMREK